MVDDTEVREVREIVRHVYEMGTFIGEEEGAGEKRGKRELCDTTQ